MNYHIERFCKRIGCVILLVCVVIFLAWGSKDSQSEPYHNEYADDDTVAQESDKVFSENDDSTSGFTEDKERNRREGILYTVDDTEKVTLTSRNGEICVKIPQWKGFSTKWTGSYVYERCQMSNENYDFIDFELIAFWNPKEAEKEILEDFGRHYNRDNILGDVYHMTVDGIEIYYRPCYEFVHSQTIDWHYMAWADLGCGQFLTTEFHEGKMSDEVWMRAYDYEVVPREVTEPLNIEGVIEALYSNIEVCTSEGDPVPIAYRESLPENEERAYYNFSYGTVREYKTDEYRETTVCAELIESLYEAVQAGNIEKLLQQESLEVKELSIAEKMDYIKKEETGTLIKHDARNAHARKSGSIPPTKYYLVEGADDSEEFFIYRGYYYWDDLYSYVWFPCKKDGTGAIRAQKGIYIFGADTQEHYFLSSQGNPYLCIVNRDSKDEIKSVVLYDFATPDYIGTLIYIDDSSVRLCSYIRNDDGYGTEMPWYLFDNKIDSGKEFFAMLEQWKITEFLGESDALCVEDTASAAYAREQKRTQDLVDTYLGQEINMSWDRNEHDLTFFQSASVYGYYYTSHENLYKVYGQPETLAMEAPFSCATMRVIGFDEDIDIIVDKNGKAAICVEGRFFRLEKSDEETEELRTWE